MIRKVVRGQTTEVGVFDEQRQMKFGIRQTGDGVYIKSPSGVEVFAALRTRGRRGGWDVSRRQHWDFEFLTDVSEHYLGRKLFPYRIDLAAALPDEFNDSYFYFGQKPAQHGSVGIVYFVDNAKNRRLGLHMFIGVLDSLHGCRVDGSGVMVRVDQDSGQYVELINSQFVRTLAAGHGCRFSQSQVLRGSFKNGMLDGMGCSIVHANGVLYTGAVVRSRYNGRGVLITPQYIYEGEFVNGVKEGLGVLRYNDGSYYYDGHFKNDVRDGYGRAVSDDGTKYTGYFVDEVYSGYGELETTQFSYKGNFCNNMFNGGGEYKDSRGNTFTGRFVNNEMCGRGVMTTTDGNTFDGLFEHNQLVGSAIIQFADGRIYQGEVKNFIFCGKCDYYKDGNTVYKGMMADGMKHGRGELTIYTGDYITEYYNGFFQNNVYSGYGELTKDGTTYKGQFVEGMKDGQGEQVDSNGDRYVGLFKGNHYNGLGTMYYYDGDMFVGHFSNGKRVGTGRQTIRSSVYIVDYTKNPPEYTGANKQITITKFYDDSCNLNIGCQREGVLYCGIRIAKNEMMLLTPQQNSCKMTFEEGRPLNDKCIVTPPDTADVKFTELKVVHYLLTNSNEKPDYACEQYSYFGRPPSGGATPCFIIFHQSSAVLFGGVIDALPASLEKLCGKGMLLKHKDGRLVQFFSDNIINGKVQGRSCVISKDKYFVAHVRDDEPQKTSDAVLMDGNSKVLYQGSVNAQFQKDGYGVETDTDGDVYKGGFCNDLRSGPGEIQYKDGSLFRGVFVDGERHGRGSIRICDRLFEGIFSPGTPTAYTSITQILTASNHAAVIKKLEERLAAFEAAVMELKDAQKTVRNIITETDSLQKDLSLSNYQKFVNSKLQSGRLQTAQQECDLVRDRMKDTEELVRYIQIEENDRASMGVHSDGIYSLYKSGDSYVHVLNIEHQHLYGVQAIIGENKLERNAISIENGCLSIAASVTVLYYDNNMKRQRIVAVKRALEVQRLETSV